MLKYIFYIAILFCSLSCKKNTVNTELLLGDWEFSSPKTIYEDDSLFSTTYVRPDLNFRKDSIVFWKGGFFQKQEEKNEIKYFGEKSKYYIENDSLHILIPTVKKYYGQKIIKLTKDTLALYEKDEKIIFYYTKRKPDIPSKINLSQITLTLGPCFGDCPISSISIDSDGNIVYLGESNTRFNGLFKGKINKEIFSEIVSDLNKIKFTGLKNEYSIEVTDLPDLSVTFIDDKKIIKTIYAYGNTEPKQLSSILTKIKYAYQDSNLKKIEYDYPLIHPMKDMHILPSETFYLQTLIINAPKSNSSFKPKYSGKTSLIVPENFDYEKYSQLDRVIKTDGRYFTLEDKSHQYSTFDIGFDFFKINHSFFQNKK
ncbi:DUF6438 domain-containing protein [Chryseobacterium sp.]|uniref:DUF6438 domain-containing protein n=1 Tax=Chryseobacterium sp. TaxID=1871047 RepID=UPI00289E9DCE|nr:DUF6438 domain-containing protein [Chryseobacterium sp.]